MKKIIFLQIACATLNVIHMQNILASETSQADDVATLQSEAVINATAKTRALVEDAMATMDDARKQLFAKTMDAMQVATIIKEQVILIAQAKQELKETISQAVQKVENEQGYLDYFVSGVKKIGAKIIAPFKTDYGYTQKEKELATKIIAGLVEQEDKLTQEYERFRSKKRLELKHRYEETIAKLNDEISMQQLISGDQIDTKKVFYAVALAGAALAGMALMAPEESKAILQKQVALTVPVLTPQDMQQQEVEQKSEVQGDLGRVLVQPEDLAKGSGVLPVVSETSTELPQGEGVSGAGTSSDKEQEQGQEQKIEEEKQERFGKESTEYKVGLSEEAAQKQKEHAEKIVYFEEKERLAAEQRANEQKEKERLEEEVRQQDLEQQRIAEEERLAAEQRANEQKEKERLEEEARQQDLEQQRIAEEERLAAEQRANEQKEKERLEEEARQQDLERQRLAEEEESKNKNKGDESNQGDTGQGSTESTDELQSQAFNAEQIQDTKKLINL